MAILKCKYCGGNISPFPENQLGTCTSCGAMMTLPKNTDKQYASAYNAGNYFRRAGQFDKALAIYQKLLSQDETDAESCWCSALCRFGVQYYEEDGVYHPAVLRPTSGNFLESSDYLAAISFSGGAVQLLYEKEARRIAQAMAAPDSSDAGVPEAAPVTPPPEASVPPAPNPNAPLSPAALVKQGFEKLGQKNWEEADGCFAQALEKQPENDMASLGRLLAQFRCATPKELPNCGQDISQSEYYAKALQSANVTVKKYLLSSVKQIQRKSQLDKIEAAYLQACTIMTAAADEAQYRQAAQLFAKLNDYKDSRAQVQECLKQAENLRKDGIYRTAIKAMEHKKAAEAAALFQQLPGWRNADALAQQCQTLQANQAHRKGRRVKFFRRAAITVAVVAALAVSGRLFIQEYWIPQQNYEAAETMLEAGNHEEAIEAFQALGTFKDSAVRAQNIQEDWYQQAEVLLNAGDSSRAAAIFGGLRDYSDARERSNALWASIVQPEYISAGGRSTAALRVDHMVNAVGNDQEKQCQVGSWLNIISVSAGWAHTLGLRADGTVVATGYNGDGRCNVDDWRNMVAISAGQWHTVGLKSNGRVIGLGCPNDGRIDLDGWRDIIAISAGRNHTVGLCADRTAVAAGSNDRKQCNVGGWKNLQMVSAGGAHTLGLTRDGKVLVTGSNDENQCDVLDWENITAVSAGYYHSVGLKADGTVVAVGHNEYGQCNVSDWTDIVAISAGAWHTVGLKADGSVVATGLDSSEQCDVLGWDNLLVP